MSISQDYQRIAELCGLASEDASRLCADLKAAYRHGGISKTACRIRAGLLWDRQYQGKALAWWLATGLAPAAAAAAGSQEPR